MVEPVARLLIGRGHPVIRAREVGLDGDEDIVIADFALERGDLVVVTFDHDFRRAVVRRGCRCLHIEVVRQRRGIDSRMCIARYLPASPRANETSYCWPAGRLDRPTMRSALECCVWDSAARYRLGNGAASGVTAAGAPAMIGP